MRYNNESLKKIRTQHGLTQAQMAEAMGLGSAAAYNKKEKHGEPLSIAQLEMLSAKLKTDISEFFEFTGDEPIFNKFKSNRRKGDEIMTVENLWSVIKTLQNQIELLQNQSENRLNPQGRHNPAKMV